MPFPKTVLIAAHTYAFELTVAAHRRVKLLAGISLPDCVADVTSLKTNEEREQALDGFRALMSDFDRLPTVFYAMLQPQLQANNVTEPQFYELLDGPAISASGMAVTQALIDFFPDDPRGTILASAVEASARMAKAGQTMTQKTAAALNSRITEIETNISQHGDQAAAAMIQSKLTTLSMTLPASLAPILAPTPSTAS